MYNIDCKKLNLVAEDFKYLLNRNYPRKASLSLVGDRYNLNSKHRQLLHRAVYSTKVSDKRINKLISVKKLNDKIIGIDGHNVLITIESALKNIPLISTSDGVVRDIAGVSNKYKISDYTHQTINLLIKFFKDKNIKNIDFYFDSPISHSKKLSKIIEQIFSQSNIPCKSFVINAPGKKLINYNIIATSNSVLIDKGKKIIDIAGLIIKENNLHIIELGIYKK